MTKSLLVALTTPRQQLEAVQIEPGVPLLCIDRRAEADMFWAQSQYSDRGLHEEVDHEMRKFPAIFIPETPALIRKQHIRGEFSVGTAYFLASTYAAIDYEKESGKLSMNVFCDGKPKKIKSLIDKIRANAIVWEYTPDPLERIVTFYATSVLMGDSQVISGLEKEIEKNTYS